MCIWNNERERERRGNELKERHRGYRGFVHMENRRWTRTRRYEAGREREGGRETEKERGKDMEQRKYGEVENGVDNQRE